MAVKSGELDAYGMKVPVPAWIAASLEVNEGRDRSDHANHDATSADAPAAGRASLNYSNAAGTLFLVPRVPARGGVVRARRLMCREDYRQADGIKSSRPAKDIARSTMSLWPTRHGSQPYPRISPTGRTTGETGSRSGVSSVPRSLLAPPS
jgi:hypothetical protein